MVLDTSYTSERGQYTGAPGLHPVSVVFPTVEYRNKLYAVPILGLLLKEIMLIPFLIAVYIVYLIVGLASLLTWIPVLFVGKYAGFADTLYGGYVRWLCRIATYGTGLQDKYPSFSFSDDPGADDVSISWPFNEHPNKFWAIPVVGILVKALICIPHFICLGVLGFVCGLLMLVTWIPVITTGQYPEWGLNVVGGTIRWQARVLTFMYGIHDQYPPFSLS
jgi:hypothetical protein